MLFITVKAEKAGFHCWPNAPKEVEFLRHKHRHLFKVEAEIQVYTDDRELEFFIVQKQLNHILDEIFAENLRNLSCEMIAEKVQTKLKKRFPREFESRNINVRVLEDGENGVYLVDKTP